MSVSRRNSHYTADDISVLDGLPLMKNSSSPRPYIDLHPEKLHGITQEESDRRYESVLSSVTMVEAAGLTPSEKLLLQLRRYIAGEIAWEDIKIY